MPAAIAPARIATGLVTMNQPALSQGCPRLRYAVQFPAPRRNVAADIVPVVVAACSMYGRKLNEYFAWSRSGTTHQLVASATAPAQQPPSLSSRRPRAWVTMNSAGKIRASSVEVALTPPMHSTATPDRATAPATGPPRAALTSGSTAHGASSPGSSPAEVDPITIVTVGHRVKASPATTVDRIVPIPSSRASLTRPVKPTAMSTESHNRSATQTGSWSSLAPR